MSVLTPKRVARAIGVSESSLKRWCDQGLISTTKTAGGHRRLTLESVLEFLRSRSHPLVRPELLGLPATSGSGPRSLPRARDLLFESLLKGDEEASRQIVYDLVLAEHPLSEIADTVVAPVFHRIGEGWDCGDVAVYEERRACEVCERILLDIRRHLGHPPEHAPLAIGGSPEGDFYTIPRSLADLVLMQQGWRTHPLGSNLPFQTLASAVQTLQPKLLWLSVSYVSDEAQFLRDYNQLFEQVNQQVAIAVGGRALTPRLRQEIRCGAICDNFRHLEAFASTILHLIAPPASD